MQKGSARYQCTYGKDGSGYLRVDVFGFAVLEAAVVKRVLLVGVTRGGRSAQAGLENNKVAGRLDLSSVSDGRVTNDTDVLSCFNCPRAVYVVKRIVRCRRLLIELVNKAQWFPDRLVRLQCNASLTRVCSHRVPTDGARG